MRVDLILFMITVSWNELWKFVTRQWTNASVFCRHDVIDVTLQAHQ
jgi:hypothetical protein